MLTPLFLPTSEGRLYLSVYHPADTASARGWVLHLPAFAEEMNKSRPMVSKQARALASAGFCVVVPDLYASGDSDGIFAATDWQHWLRDISHILGWIQSQGGATVQLWGLRLGCLMALQVARNNPHIVSQLVLWQPVTMGKQYVNQFLRLRMAAGLMEGKSESTAELRAILASGRNLEVAGYELQPSLVEQLDALESANLAPPVSIKTIWLEVAASEERPLAAISRKTIELWEGAGVPVTARVVEGEPFWSTQEIGYSPSLLITTSEIVQELPTLPEVYSPIILHSASDDPGSNLRPLVFGYGADELVGMLHPGLPSADTAVLVVVGGPQYRVGSHRQFVHLARALGAAGVPVLRFDYRGMGDSSGELLGFEYIADDITAALDALQSQLPNIKRVVLWGLCDAASAACFYAPTDQRVAGLVLLNPWARSESGEARTFLKHYYLQRLASWDFWKSLVGGRVNLAATVTSLKDNLVRALSVESSDGAHPNPDIETKTEERSSHTQKGPLIERMFAGLSRFRHPVMIIISGRDLTAAEFTGACHSHRSFRRLLTENRIQRRDLPEADHTFSREVWRQQVAQWTITWLKSL